MTKRLWWAWGCSGTDGQGGPSQEGRSGADLPMGWEKKG